MFDISNKTFDISNTLIITLALLSLAFCKPAPPQLAIPEAVQAYLCGYAGMHATIIPRDPHLGGQPLAMVSFYAGPGEGHWLGLGTFVLLEGGSLGDMVEFRWPGGEQWSRAEYP